MAGALPIVRGCICGGQPVDRNALCEVAQELQWSGCYLDLWGGGAAYDVHSSSCVDDASWCVGTMWMEAWQTR